MYNWLSDGENGKWLIVLDNVDNAEFLLQNRAMTAEAHTSSSSSARPLSTYLPISPNGSILITSRTRAVALKLVERGDIIAVEPMDETHAIELFEKKLDMQGDKKDVGELVAALEFMPLAVVQAAAYIAQRAPRCSVRNYIERFQKTDKNKVRLLLDYEAGHLRRDQEAKNSILTTWQISLDEIQKSRPSAADLLSLMSFFDRQGIPEALIRNRGDEGADENSDTRSPSKPSPEEEDEDSDGSSSLGSSTGEEDQAFEDDILTLRNYSFISINNDGFSFEMHRLVQLATRTWLKAHEQLEKWNQQSIKNLCQEFPGRGHENWAKCGVLFPHVKLALTQQPEGKVALEEWASLMRDAAWYADDIGKSADAEEMSVKSMKVSNRLLGEADQRTLRSMLVVASLYCKRGLYKEAEELGIQLLEGSKKMLGLEHLETLKSMSVLAVVYNKQGRLKEAEELDIQVLETERRVLGLEHPETLCTLSNLAATYLTQGRYKEAEEMNTQVIETEKRVLGVEHPDTLISMSNLTTVYRGQGRFKEAEELDILVLETSKKILGLEHPDTLINMSNLALVYNSQGRFKEAEELYILVVETRKRILGLEHSDTLINMSNLAFVYNSQGRFKEAEELYIQVLGTKKRILGLEHPDTLPSMSDLAWVWHSRGFVEKAIGLMAECVKLRQRKLGKDHPHSIKSLITLNRWKARKAEFGSGNGPEVSSDSPDSDSKNIENKEKREDIEDETVVARSTGSEVTL